MLNPPLFHHVSALHISPQLLSPGSALSELLLLWLSYLLPQGLCFGCAFQLSISSPRCHIHLCPMPTLPLLSLTAGIGTDIDPETCTHWLTVLGQLSLSDPPKFPVAESKQIESQDKLGALPARSAECPGAQAWAVQHDRYVLAGCQGPTPHCHCHHDWRESLQRPPLPAPLRQVAGSQQKHCGQHLACNQRAFLARCHLCPREGVLYHPEGPTGPLWDGWALAFWICMSSHRGPRLSDSDPGLITSLT